MKVKAKIIKSRDFATEVARVLPLIMREFTRRQKSFFTRSLLTVPQVVILEFLAEGGLCQMNELARALNFSMSAVTAIVDKMVRARLVRRERSTKDRRVVNVSILEKGKKVARAVTQSRRECINELFAGLTEPEHTEYLRILTKAYNNLRRGR